MELLDALGLKPEQITDQILERVTAKVLAGFAIDDLEDDGNGDATCFEGLQERFDTRVREAIDAGVQQYIERLVAPMVQNQIEQVVLQETNRWGEKTSRKAIPFKEYLCERADAWLMEQVNHDGKAKDEERGGYWSANTTRIAYLIDRYLQYHIEQAMKAALGNANNAIVGGLEQAVKVALDNVREKLAVTVKVK